MEIFLVGIVIVALMVFVSTKIKKSAAQAFVPEFIEKDEFTLTKPEGFMSPLEENFGYAFEAYSREYGEKKARNTWQAHAFLTVSENLNFDRECEKAKQSADKISSENFFANDLKTEKIFLLESQRNENDIQMIDFWKIVESAKYKKTYNLQIAVLQSFREVYIDRINEMINSFHLK